MPEYSAPRTSNRSSPGSRTNWKRRASSQPNKTISESCGERASLEAQAENLTDAIAQGGRTERLARRLDELEAKISDLDRQIAREGSQPKPGVLPTDEQIRQAIADVMKDLRDALNGEDRQEARRVLHQHLNKLVLTPTEQGGRTVFQVTGEFKLDQPSKDPRMGKGKCRKVLVARDGIEPPTPAFSGPRSTN